MSKYIGERIKRLRKELKLTQVQLAGDKMTKSMISQIENGQATPSVNNLKYLANRLKQPVSFFLEQESISKIPLKDINAQLKSISLLIGESEYDLSLSKLTNLLTAHSYSNHKKLKADILFLCGKCLNKLSRFMEANDYLDLAIKLYCKEQLYSKAAITYLEKLNSYFKEYDYEGCKDIIAKAKDISSLSITKHIPVSIDILYIESIVNLSLGNFRLGICNLNEALELCKSEEVYYKASQIHQTIASISLITKKYSDFTHHIKKALQFATYTENQDQLDIIYFNYAEYEIMINNPKASLGYLEKMVCSSNKLELFYKQELAKAYYLLKDYNKALAIFKDINYSKLYGEILKHDYLMACSSKVYHGLTLMELGKHKKALQCISEAIEKLEEFSPSVYLIFAYKSISDLYQRLSDYKTAFNYLKKANDLNDALGDNPY